MRKLYTVILASILLSGQGAFCLDESTINPQFQTWLTSTLEEVRKSHNLPAISTAVVIGEELYGAAAVGIRAVGSHSKVTVRDKFHLGSNGKAMTATLMAMLIEKGKLRWDSTVSETLPKLAKAMHPDNRNITITQLLQHRSGLEEAPIRERDKIDWSKMTGTVRMQRQKYAKTLLKEPPVYQAGSKTLYCNVNYIIAGAIIEETLNKPWETAIKEYLFNPLKMKTAGFGPMGTENSLTQPRGHYLENSRYIPLYSDNLPFGGPAGRVHCSAVDFARFALMHKQGQQGKGNLLSPETFKILHSPAKDSPLAMGWAAYSPNAEGLYNLSHGGSNNLNAADMRIHTSKDVIVLVMINAAPSGPDIIGEITQKILEHLTERAKAKDSKTDSANAPQAHLCRPSIPSSKLG